jgi:hypothetical protein
MRACPCLPADWSIGPDAVNALSALQAWARRAESRGLSAFPKIVCLRIADRGYLIEAGRIVGEGTAARLSGDPAVQQAYLGFAGNEKPIPPDGASRPRCSTLTIVIWQTLFRFSRT